jgi:NDP-sugar pyrophosphorylase family protein
MNAMILAAGLGTRLGSIGRSTPKVLIDIDGRPLLERNLDCLLRQGISRVVINVHHHAARIESFLQSYDGPLQVISVHEQRLLGTAGGVRNALQHLEPGPFLVLYGDVLVAQPLDSLIEFHLSERPLATLAVHEAEASAGKGVVGVDSTGRVTSFAEKQHRGAGRVLINSGIYVLESELLASLAAGSVCDFGEDVFPRAIASGSAIFASRLASPVIDIGTPEGLSLARASVSTSAVAVGGSAPRL